MPVDDSVIININSKLKTSFDLSKNLNDVIGVYYDLSKAATNTADATNDFNIQYQYTIKKEWACEYCGSPNNLIMTHCSQCGAPRRAL